MVPFMLFTTFPLEVFYFGNFTIDTKVVKVDGNEIVKESFGGSVNFGSHTISKFFNNIHVTIYSIGYPEFVKKEFGASWEKNNQNLTHYVLDYTGQERKLFLKYFPPRTLSLPSTTNVIPQIIMITPIYKELSEKTVIALKKSYPNSFIACDPQGWCREKDSDSDKIILKEWFPTQEFLSAVQLIKISVEDIKKKTLQTLTGYIKTIIDSKVILVVTGGKNGSVCFIPSQTNDFVECFYCPVKEVTNIIDTTGAGDVWLIAFTLMYYLTKNVKRSLSSASILSSLKIQSEGLHFKSISQEQLDKLIQNHEKEIIPLGINNGIDKILYFD